MSSKKYWCPTCKEITPSDFMGLANAIVHTVETCNSTSIPVVEPLDVPEVTTWGESGGAGEVCYGQAHDKAMRIWRLGDDDRVRVDFWAGYWWLTGGRHRVENTDIVDAINYVAGVER